MPIEKDLLEKKDAILQIAAKHGAYNIRVFGSGAVGHFRPDSDVDLLVNVKPVHSPFFPGGLIADLEELLHRKVDIVEPDGLHWYIRDKVLASAVPL